METILYLIEDQVLTLAFLFSLVFIAGIAFGYINGVADRKTAPPKYTPPRKTADDLEAFEKEYRREVLQGPTAEETQKTTDEIFNLLKQNLKQNPNKN